MALLDMDNLLLFRFVANEIEYKLQWQSNNKLDF